MLWTLWRGSIILWFLCCESFLIGLFPLLLNMRHGSDIKLLERERMNGFRCHGLDSKHVTTSTTFVLFHVHFNFNFRLDWLGKVISIDDVKVMGELFILFSPFYLFRLICGQFVIFMTLSDWQDNHSDLRHLQLPQVPDVTRTKKYNLLVKLHHDGPILNLTWCSLQMRLFKVIYECATNLLKLKIEMCNQFIMLEKTLLMDTQIVLYSVSLSLSVCVCVCVSSLSGTHRPTDWVRLSVHSLSSKQS